MSGLLSWLKTGITGAGSANAKSPVPVSASDPLPTILRDSSGAEVIFAADEYETVAASQSDQSLGATGSAGDYLSHLVIVVATAATAQVQIKDGGGSAITVFPNSPGGGVGTYTVPLGLRSLAGAWKITTGAGVSVIAAGNFT